MLAGICNCFSKVLRRGPVQIWLVRQQGRAAITATSKAESRVELSADTRVWSRAGASRVQRIKTNNNDTNSHISSCGPKQSRSLGHKNLAPQADQYTQPPASPVGRQLLAGPGGSRAHRRESNGNAAMLPEALRSAQKPGASEWLRSRGSAANAAGLLEPQGIPGGSACFGSVGAAFCKGLSEGRRAKRIRSL